MLVKKQKARAKKQLVKLRTLRLVLLTVLLVQLEVELHHWLETLKLKVRYFQT